MDRSSLRWDRMGEAIPGGDFENATTRACVSGDGGTVAVGVADTDDTVRPRARRGVPVELDRRGLVRMGHRILGNGTTAGSRRCRCRATARPSTTYSHDVYPVAAVLHWNGVIEGGFARVVEHRGAAASRRRAGPRCRRRGVRALATPRRPRGHRDGERRLHRESRARGNLHAHLQVRVQVLDATCSKTGRSPGSCASSWCGGCDSRRLCHGVGGGG